MHNITCRFIGRPFNDKSVQNDLKLYSFNVVSNLDGQSVFQVEYKNETKYFLPEQISAMILSKMKQIASKYLNENVDHAVITVPAYFNDNQRMATKLAAKIAGLNVLRIINEPTAASIAFGLGTGNADQSEKNIIVYDLGGGTFDVSLLTVENGIFDVISTNGNTHLGGQDFDQNIVDYFVEKFNQKHDIDLKKIEYMNGLNKLRNECEKAKRALSSPDVKTFQIKIDNIDENGIDFDEYLTQSQFESLNNDIFLQTLKPLRQVLNDAQFSIDDIDEIVMVGGSTRIPKIQSIVSKFFNNKKLNFVLNPDEAVARGAAIQGAMLSNHISQCTNGDHIVLDVTPLSLGIKTVGDIFTKMIDKNSKIPTKQSKIFTTSYDNQSKVSIEIYQGERPMIKDNIFLGKFDLNNIDLAPKGVPQIEVTFKIDVDGIVTVQARDKNKPLNHQQITIDKHNSHPSHAKILQMLNDQKMFEKDDKLLMDKIKLKNEMQNNAYHIKHQFGGDDDTIDQVCDEMIQWLQNIDVIMTSLNIDDLKNKKNEFENIVGDMIEQMQSNSKMYHDDIDDDDNYYDHDDL